MSQGVHTLAAVLPVASEKVPATQLMQLERELLPMTVEYVPVAQGVHESMDVLPMPVE